MLIIHIDVLQVCEEKKYMNFLGVILPSSCAGIENISSLKKGTVYFKDGSEKTDVQKFFIPYLICLNEKKDEPCKKATKICKHSIHKNSNFLLQSQENLTSMDSGFKYISQVECNGVCFSLLEESAESAKKVKCYGIHKNVICIIEDPKTYLIFNLQKFRTR